MRRVPVASNERLPPGGGGARPCGRIHGIMPSREGAAEEMRVAVVKAAHDDEAGVWYVQASDLEGLHVEGETFEAFCRNVTDAVADLLEGEADAG